MRVLKSAFGAAAVALFAALAAAPASAQQDRHVKIINETQHELREFYASNTNVDDWLQDRLGDGTLDVGESITLDITDGSDACNFDFKAVFAEGGEEIGNNLNVCQISTYRYTEDDEIEGAVSGDQNRQVNIQNESTHVLREFYASRIGIDDWEEDILGQDTLAAGQSVSVNIDDGTDSCLFDFKAVYDNNAEVVNNRINVCTVSNFRYSGDATITGAVNDGGSTGGSGPADANRRVRIINETHRVLREFYASSTSKDVWDQDRLGQDTLAVGQSITLDITDGTNECHFDFKGIFADGEEVISSDINVCQVSDYRFTEGLSGGVSDGENRHVSIHNDSAQPIREFYASRIGIDDWEEDILGRDTLAAGASVDVNIDDGSGSCLFDFKAVFADGTSKTRSRINVCVVSEYHFD
jgi:hypothetical protein